MRSVLTSALSLMVLTTASCRPPPDPPICAEYVEHDPAASADTRVLPFDVWYTILVPGTARRPALELPESPRECSGRPVAVRLSGQQDSAPPYSHTAAPIPRESITEKDITFSPAPDGKLLIWARVEYYADQTAIGPVALVQLVERGVEIRGIGTLLAPHKRANLYLEPFADGDSLLVASGDICPSEGDICRKETHFLPLVGQRFIQAGVIVDGEFEGPAKVAAHERVDVSDDVDGWIRREEVDRTLRVTETELSIAETVTILKCDARVTPPECSEYKTTQHSRVMTWTDGYFTTTSGVWERMRAE